MSLEKEANSSFKTQWLAIGSVLLFLAGKLKWLLVVLKFFKFSTLISLFISLGAYAWAYGWKFAVALVYLLFLHEMGHLYAAKRKGIPTSNAIFLPFVGALVALKEEPKSAKDEAYLAYGGPLLGTIAFLPAIPLYILTQEPFWALVITIGAMINFFNLIPVHPLDGGRIVTVISTKFWILGIIVMIVYLFNKPNPILSIFLIFGVIKCWEQFRKDIHFIQTNIENKLYQEAIEELERYDALTSYEQAQLLEAWKEEKINARQLLLNMRKIYLPFLEDQKKEEKYRLEFLVRIRTEMIDLKEAYDNGPKIEKYRQEIQNNRDNMQKKAIYYHSDWNTKVLWLALYVGLALVLLGGTMYGSEIMQKQQHLLNR